MNLSLLNSFTVQLHRRLMDEHIRDASAVELSRWGEREWEYHIKCTSTHQRAPSCDHMNIYEFFISPKTVLSHLARTKSHHIRRFHSERLELYPLRILWLWLQIIDRNSTLGVSILRTECLHLLHTRWDWWQTSETNGHIDTVGRAIWSRSRQLQHTIHNDLSLQSVWRCKFFTLSYATHDVQCLLKFLCEYHHFWVSLAIAS